MHGHPEVVPGQHDDGRDQYRGVEQLLPDPLQRAGDDFGQAGNDERAGDADDDAATDPAAAAGDAPRRRQHDRDDERGFKSFAEDDDCRGEHLGCPRSGR